MSPSPAVLTVDAGRSKTVGPNNLHGLAGVAHDLVQLEQIQASQGPVDRWHRWHLQLAVRILALFTFEELDDVLAQDIVPVPVRVASVNAVVPTGAAGMGVSVQGDDHGLEAVVDCAKALEPHAADVVIVGGPVQVRVLRLDLQDLGRKAAGVV